MPTDWQALTALTQGRPLTVERVRIGGENITIEGEFELPPLARFSFEDQVFVAAFVRAHGSIKEMEKLFGISYPTVKSRLNRLSEDLSFVHIQVARNEETAEAEAARPKRGGHILDRLEAGEITAEEAISLLRVSGVKKPTI